MKKIINKNKRGFVALSKVVQILDNKGKEFYYYDNFSDKNNSFNLPKGTFYLNRGKIKLGEFVKYELPDLPANERDRKIVNFAIKYANVPEKCVLNWAEKTVIFDNSFKVLPRLNFDFTVYHEFGHAKYNTEKFADLYAVRKMLQNGYNPSQVLIAQAQTLTKPVSNKRKEFIYSVLTKFNRIIK